MSFFQGTLQEGIAAALQQAKAVVCFVTDGETESRQWEDEFFTDGEVLPLLQATSVSLRLVAGSQEEGFLAQLYPIPKKPTVVVIRNAELKEYIAAGVSKAEFVRRLKAVLSPAQPPPNQPVPTQAAPAQPQAVATTAPPVEQSNHVEDSSASSAGQVTPPSPTESRSHVLLAERAARLAEQKKKDDEEAKRRAIEKGKAKAEPGASGSKTTDEQSKHAAALKKQRQEAREERARVLKAIEDDKAARKAQQAEAAAARKLSAAWEKKPDSSTQGTTSQVRPPAGKQSEHCAIQVRLFDGSTIRNRFSSTDTLNDVRNWVNEARGDGKDAFTFKVLLTPMPSRTIDVTEENKTLRELELTPSSTLILLRVTKPTSAYLPSARSAAEGAPEGNVFQRIIAYFLGIVIAFFSTVAAFFSTLLSTTGPPAAPEQPGASQTSESQTPAADAARRRAARRIAGLGDIDGQRSDQQFYNGNSVNFEPRPDDGE
ncbi:hypothetical protein MYCTH_2297891 [Thermothelomyces thermophilus ATCC 42464]|uniref:UBX domain-containing protein 2 n=1 Tax=Thermothelomyces thermophilus (strain ATCC 42464 / BCRC 31852 / DSM 1799) TaxID=573729 RepID=G2Q009_THET4|nr:uncharacterized protein MYCTH_2297891 [Thermothelomyces thermophilus ATCC 42464]AEO54833.1 hypothetical protein MYCTH_2297891 [Thermothelomyces thermophilus ATCC 42464]